MNTIVKLMLALFGATCSTFTVAEEAKSELTANISFDSKYYYRGILIEESSAKAGIDYENGGFYVGAALADVGKGLEVSKYLGYVAELEVGLVVGLELYRVDYTGNFDDTYEEIKLNLGFGVASLDYVVGTYDNFGGPVQHFDYTAFTLKKNGFYATYGIHGKEFSGDFVKLGYGKELGTVHLGVAALFNSEEISNECDSAGRDTSGECIGKPERGEAIVFTISKSFELF